MAGQGLALLGGAAGAGNALKELLATRFKQQLEQQQQAELLRSNQANEGYRNRALDETVKQRQAGEAATEQERQFQHQLRQDQLAQAMQIAQGSQAGQTERAGVTASAAAERAAADRASREQIAQSGRETQLSIAQLGAGQRAQTLSDKQAKDAEDIATKRRTMVDLAKDTGSVIDQLLTPEGTLQPGVSGITGQLRVPSMLTGVPGIREAASFMSGGDIANKQAAFDRLKSRALIDLIAEMKSQTRTGATGFGQLSEKEGQILQNAAAQLGQAQTEGQIATVLQDMRGKINKILMEPGAAPVAGPAQPAPASAGPTTGWVDLGNGVRVRRK